MVERSSPLVLAGMFANTTTHVRRRTQQHRLHDSHCSQTTTDQRESEALRSSRQLVEVMWSHGHLQSARRAVPPNQALYYTIFF